MNNFSGTKQVCHADAPYPPIRVTAPNKYYANILLVNYSGAVGELGAITQYFYHHLSLMEQYADVSSTLECISIAEMHHLEMLGKLIVLLGGDPRYWIIRNNRPVYWNAKYLAYATELDKALQSDIDDEHKAIEGYRNSIKLIDDPSIQAVLERIILDEQTHIKILNSMLERYGKQLK